MMSPVERHRMAWDTAARCYLDTIKDGYALYDTDVAFHAAVYLAADVVSFLLSLYPEGPPLTGLDHLVRRVAMTSQAALVEHRGQMDVDALLADGWKWAEGEEQAFGKRLRWLVPPDPLFLQRAET